VANEIGVCSWSLRPSSPEELIEALGAVGIARVQLALDPLRTGAWPADDARAMLFGAGVTLVSGMMATRGEDYATLESIRRTGGLRPVEHWEENRAAASANARRAARRGLALVTLHAGFLPEELGRERTKLVSRLREVVDRFADEGVDVAFETGQETATTLVGVLEELDRPRAGVNFDPANMLLYGMGEPLEALDLLAPWVRQIHVKDARRAAEPGVWGLEVPVGEGEVDWSRFFGLVRAHDLACDLVIEREAGADRATDIRAAKRLVEALHA
jgi:sugar phosphate isomerase/epimerase